MSLTGNRFVFAGNRAFVLDEMIQLGINPIAIFCVKNSFLEKELTIRGTRHIIISGKQSLIEQLEKLEFDWFVANGLPIILPISQLQTANNKKFINIHPSYLPDLKGVDPVPGAILYGRDSGATCHFMDDGIDTGAIISQVKIPYQMGMGADFLYQLSFLAERQVFREAFDKEFKKSKRQIRTDGDRYYKFNEDDLLIKFTDTDEVIIKKINAFNTPSKKARFKVGNITFTVCRAMSFEKSLFDHLFKGYKVNRVVLKYNGSILLKRSSTYLLLMKVQGDMDSILKNDTLR